MKRSERKRLEAVSQFEQLNLSDNKELNDLITLTIEICNVPTALISLMGKNTQSIKCQSGVITIEDGSLENAFCKYLINSKEVMVIPDTLNNECFINHPAVTGGHGIRFYAGAPLITSSGFHIGSLCVLDQKPGMFSKKQKDMLGILALQVVSVMELQMSLKQVALYNAELSIQKEKTAASELKLRAFFNSSSSCHTVIGRGLEILDFNKAMAHFIKRIYNKKIEAGKNILYYINSSYKSEFKNYVKCAFAGKHIHKEILINDGKGFAWWNISFTPVKDEEGNIISVVNSATNINEQKQQVVEIIAQNESLINIAYIQSHEYRKPVATILGLMNVIKTYNYKANKECLLMMEKAVKELDDKIRSVVNCTQDNILSEYYHHKQIPFNF